MRRHPVYALVGVLVLGTALAAEYRGWTLTRPGRGTAVPRDVRENPGAYRTVYRGSYRYLHGK